jgi:hypothetical protein
MTRLIACLKSGTSRVAHYKSSAVMVKEGADPSGKGSEPDADRHNNNTNCKWVLSALRVVVNGVAGRVVSDVSTPNLIISNTSARVGCINIPRTFIMKHEH